MIFGNFCQENKNYNKNIKIEYNKIHDNFFFLQYLFTIFFFFYNTFSICLSLCCPRNWSLRQAIVII